MTTVKMKSRVTIHTKATGGATVNTAAQFIPVEMLTRLGRYGATRSERTALWRLEHRDHVHDYQAAYRQARRTVAARQLDNAGS